MKSFGVSAAVLAGALVVAIFAPASAHNGANHSGGPPAVAVPEIDAASGLAALSAVCAALAPTRERRRS